MTIFTEMTLEMPANIDVTLGNPMIPSGQTFGVTTFLMLSVAAIVAKSRRDGIKEVVTDLVQKFSEEGYDNVDLNISEADFKIDIHLKRPDQN
jgi:hypothetical protein